MSRISTSKLALVLLVAIVLTPSAGWPAGLRFSTDDSAARIFSIENPLVAFWNYIVGFWDKEGCGLDPHGLCKTNMTGENGCGLDPHGCTSDPTSTTGETTTDQEAGCGLDPHGACKPGS